MGTFWIGLDEGEIRSVIAGNEITGISQQDTSIENILEANIGKSVEFLLQGETEWKSMIIRRVPSQIQYTMNAQPSSYQGNIRSSDSEFYMLENDGKLWFVPKNEIRLIRLPETLKRSWFKQLKTGNWC